jgi:hypothetical protein
MWNLYPVFVFATWMLIEDFFRLVLLSVVLSVRMILNLCLIQFKLVHCIKNLTLRVVKELIRHILSYYYNRSRKVESCSITL